MKDNLRKMISYYRPYMRTFVIDMIFAFLSAAITLVLPLIIRYVTSEVIYMEKREALQTVFLLGLLMFAMLGLYCYSNFYIWALLWRRLWLFLVIVIILYQIMGM